MNKIKETALVVSVSVVASLATIGTLIYILRLSDALGSKKDFWDILTALGTCAAVLVALFFGVGQQLLNRREALTRAQVVAARLVPKLTNSLENFYLLHSHLKTHVKALSAATKNPAPRFGPVKTAANRALIDASTTDLSILATLPENCAIRLARVISLIEALHRDISQYDENVWTIDLPVEARRSIAVEWFIWISECEQLLSAVLDTCSAASGEASVLGTSRNRPV